MISSRRSFLVGIGASLIAAPAVVKAASLMPVRGIVQDVRQPPWKPMWRGYYDVYRSEVQISIGGGLRWLSKEEFTKKYPEFQLAA